MPELRARLQREGRALAAIRHPGVVDKALAGGAVAQDELVDTVAKTVHVKEVGSDGTTSIVTGLKAGTAVISNGQLGVSDGQSLAQN